MARKKLPADFGVIAYAEEAERRSKKSGMAYSYGKLVADTTEEEREKIKEDYVNKHSVKK